MTNRTHVPHGAPASVHRPAYHIPRAQPAHHFTRESDVVRRPRPGGRGSPPLRGVGKVSVCNRRRPSTEGGASRTPPLTGGLYISRCGIQHKGTARAPLPPYRVRALSKHAADVYGAEGYLRPVEGLDELGGADGLRPVCEAAEIGQAAYKLLGRIEPAQLGHVEVAVAL